MRDLNHQLKILCSHSHEGSISTRVGRERILSTMAGQLHDLGFKNMEPKSLRAKHVRALVNLWLSQNLSLLMIAHMEPFEDRPIGATR